MKVFPYFFFVAFYCHNVWPLVHHIVAHEFHDKINNNGEGLCASVQGQCVAFPRRVWQCKLFPYRTKIIVFNNNGTMLNGHGNRNEPKLRFLLKLLAML